MMDTKSLIGGSLHATSSGHTIPYGDMKPAEYLSKNDGNSIFQLSIKE